MIRTLFRLDPSIRGSWALFLFGIMGGLLLRMIARQLPPDLSNLDAEAGAWLKFSLMVAYLSCLLVLIFQNCGTRTSRLFVALPVPAGTLWWVRMVALLSVAVIPTLLATVVVSAKLPDGGTGLRFETLFVLMGAKACTGLMLAAALFQLPEPELQRITPGRSYVVYVAFVSLLLILFVSLTPNHILPVLVFALATILLLIHLHRSIPNSFLLFPAEPEAEYLPTPGTPPSTEGEPGSSRPVGTPGWPESLKAARDRERYGGAISPREREGQPPNPYWTLHKTIARILWSHWQSWLLAPLIFAYSALLWDAYQSTRHPLPNILFITAWLFTLSYQVIIRLYRLDHLPISRRTLFPYLFFASVLPVLLGVGTGVVLVRPLDRTDCKVCYGAGGIEVPPAFWEIAWDGVPPEVTSPWGEQVKPTAHPIYPGSRVSVYSPYETDKTHSARFLAYQANRAVAAVNGFTPFTDAEIAQEAENPLVDLMERRAEFRRGFPIEQSIGRGSPVRARTWMLGAVVAIWILGLMSVAWLLQFWPSRFRKLFRILFFVMLGFWGATLLMGVLGALLQALDPMSSIRFPMILIRHLAEGLPSSLGSYWLVAFLSLVFFYLVLYRVFKGIEAPLGKVRPVWKEYG